MDKCRLCTEMIIEDAAASLRAAVEENPENIFTASKAHELALDLPDHFRKAENLIPAPFIAILVSKKWTAGSTLKISFVGKVNPTVKTKIVQFAGLWLKHVNLKFDFLDQGHGQIRISTEPGGSWSYIGTDAKLITTPNPTMNFGWLQPDTPDKEYERVVVHEFGHALGAIHEHQHPSAGIPWDKPKVYAYYARMGWSKDQVDTNIFAKYSMDQLNASGYDPASIMHYAVPNELTIGDWEIGWNTTLSAQDKKFIQRFYP